MKKVFVVLGVASATFLVAAPSTEAKLIRYQINGQHYSYSTNNWQQTREARERIQAAKAAEAARAQADTEAATNPFARLFGSATQRQSREAQARVQQLTLASHSAAGAPAVTFKEQPEIVSTSSVRASRAQRPRRAVARRSSPPPVRQANLGSRANEGGSLDQTLERSTARVPAGHEVQMVAPTRITPAAIRPAARPSDVPPAHGAVDSGTLADFINQVRKAAPETARN